MKRSSRVGNSSVTFDWTFCLLFIVASVQYPDTEPQSVRCVSVLNRKSRNAGAQNRNKGMKRFSTVLRLALCLVATFAIVFLAQAQRGSKRFAVPHQTKSSAHVIQVFDQNGQPAVSGVPSNTSTIFDVTVGGGNGFQFVP